MKNRWKILFEHRQRPSIRVLVVGAQDSGHAEFLAEHTLKQNDIVGMVRTQTTPVGPAEAVLTPHFTVEYKHDGGKGTQHDFCCPVCGSSQKLRIAATVWAELGPAGVEDYAGDVEWEDDSSAECQDCNWAGRVGELREIR